jgi:hypothetical protein
MRSELRMGSGCAVLRRRFAMPAGLCQRRRGVEARDVDGLGEIAEVTNRSERSLKRDWRRARAFLYLRLGGDA